MDSALVKPVICIRGNKVAQSGGVKIGFYISPSKAQVSPAGVKNRSQGAIPHSEINDFSGNLLFVNIHFNVTAL